MVSWILSRAVVLVFGTLYPAYYSYKAVKTKNMKEYVRWMMYWIVFALYTVVEAAADFSLSWFPLYYEIKIAFVIWLLSPYTKGANLIYRKFLHPLLSSREREIDDYLVQAKERSYETMVNFGKQGLTIAATAAISAAVKPLKGINWVKAVAGRLSYRCSIFGFAGYLTRMSLFWIVNGALQISLCNGQGAIAERLRSFSMHDLTQIPGDEDSSQAYLRISISGDKGKSRGYVSPDYCMYEPTEKTDEDTETFFSEEEPIAQRSLRRSQSVKSTRPKVRKEPRYGSLKIKTKRRPALNSVNYEM